MNTNIDLVMVSAGCQGPSDKNHVPLGLLYVGSSLERAGYNVKVWHLLPEEFEAAIPQMRERDPLWIGLSVLSGMTTLYAVELSQRIRSEIPSTKIVWGGHHTSAEPEQCLREDYIDYVVIGEGEDTAVELSAALLKKKPLESVLGIGWKKNDGTLIINPSRPLETDLDKYEIHWELVRMEDYLHRNYYGKVPIAFYSSRGCPYKCTFCATPFYTGKSFRAHSPEFVTRNLDYLRTRYGINSVLFSDDNFMIHRQRGLEIIQRLARIGVSVDTVDVRLNQINEKILEVFKDVGVQGIFFGYESGNDRILELMKKGIRSDQAREKVRLIAKKEIRCWASGIIGVPTETREELYQTIDFAMWLRDNLPDGSTVSTFRYMPLPKTQLIQMAVQDGFEYPRTADEWKRIDPIGPYYSSPWVKWMTPEDEKYFAWVQELGRARALNYMKNGPSVPVAINNFFVRRLRSQVESRKVSHGATVKAYNFARDVYDIMTRGKRARLRSQAKLD